ncbi:10693_t:CDS:2 [Ambispora gerdemannii]|uniref:10693_t:CDS:1 n=1 Tax=Ambispora gerdemannii TaxID=144530 RepID=A0A9N9BXR6_9GLOM|nr:10693_t:CDS:2 [Ambispora gerdemannii]
MSHCKILKKALLQKLHASLDDQLLVIKRLKLTNNTNVKHLLAAEISSNHIPKNTLIKTQKKNGIQSHIARKKPMISEINRIKRLNWAKKHKNWIKEDWRRVFGLMSPLLVLIHMERSVFGVMKMSFMFLIAHKQLLKVDASLLWSGDA